MSLLPEFDNEMANTRKTLQRVPDDKFDWKPDEKSGTMGWLATHIANLPMWATVTLAQDSLDMNPPSGERFQLPKASNREELLALFDKNAADTRAAIESATDEQFLQPWSLLNGGQTIFTMPKVAVVRTFVMNHIIHHRGQLTVYFRLNGVPVPALYGPSADEGSF